MRESVALMDHYILALGLRSTVHLMRMSRFCSIHLILTHPGPLACRRRVQLVRHRDNQIGLQNHEYSPDHLHTDLRNIES